MVGSLLTAVFDSSFLKEIAFILMRKVGIFSPTKHVLINHFCALYDLPMDFASPVTTLIARFSTVTSRLVSTFCQSASTRKRSFCWLLLSALRAFCLGSIFPQFSWMLLPSILPSCAAFLFVSSLSYASGPSSSDI